MWDRAKREVFSRAAGIRSLQALTVPKITKLGLFNFVIYTISAAQFLQFSLVTFPEKREDARNTFHIAEKEKQAAFHIFGHKAVDPLTLGNLFLTGNDGILDKMESDDYGNKTNATYQGDLFSFLKAKDLPPQTQRLVHHIRFIVEEAKQIQSLEKKAQLINNAVDVAIPYNFEKVKRSELYMYNKSNWIQSPQQTIEKGSGCCADTMELKVALLKEAGIPASRIFKAFLSVNKSSDRHGAPIVLSENGPLFLDNTTPPDPDIYEGQEYIPFIRSAFSTQPLSHVLGKDKKYTLEYVTDHEGQKTAFDTTGVFFATSTEESGLNREPFHTPHHAYKSKQELSDEGHLHYGDQAIKSLYACRFGMEKTWRTDSPLQYHIEHPELTERQATDEYISKWNKEMSYPHQTRKYRGPYANMYKQVVKDREAAEQREKAIRMATIKAQKSKKHLSPKTF